MTPWKVFKIQISVSINKLFWNTPCPFMYMVSVTAFEQQRQSWIVATKMVQVSKPKIFPVWSFTGKSLLISGLDPPPLPLAYHVSWAPCSPGFLGLQGTQILRAVKPSSPVVGTGWVGGRVRAVDVRMCAVPPRYNVCILWHKVGDNSPRECGLIDEGLQLPAGSWNNCFPLECFPLPTPCAEARALCKVLTIQVIMEGNLTHFIAIVTEIASLDAVLAVSAR